MSTDLVKLARAADYALARALWEGKRDRERAATLAAEGRDAYAKGGRGYDKERETVVAWMKKQGI